MSLCMGCMKEKGEVQVCPYCGFNETEIKNVSPAFLPPGFALNNRYIVGMALGQGGFGITYIGYDNVLNTPVAIKEYYPTDIASRTSADGTISPFTQNTDYYTRGKQRFLEEARTLAKFADHPCIVGVKDCFNANNTAYMVMEYLEGINLKEYLKRKGGVVSVEEAISTLTPVMEALKTVHSYGIIHRDISPDNIFITTKGQVRLIDFGAARQSLDGQKSLSVMLKPGYAPEEQYRSKGNQGPWTDVYALTATLYRMITGKIPPDSLERVMEDTLEIPSNIPVNIQGTIRKGLAVRADNRFSSVEQLQDALINQSFSSYEYEDNNVTKGAFNSPDDISTQYYGAESINKKSNKNVFLALCITLSFIFIAVIVSVLIIFYAGSNNNNEEEKEVYTEPVFNNVSASATTVATQKSRNYNPILVIDKDPSTAWNVTGGVGEWITLSSSNPQKVKGVKILSGYTSYSSSYKMWLYHPNNRPKDIEIVLSDGSSISHTLEDTFSENNYIYQTIDFGEYKETSSITIKINSIYKGNRWNDCCISEIQAY